MSTWGPSFKNYQWFQDGASRDSSEWEALWGCTDHIPLKPAQPGNPTGHFCLLHLLPSSGPVTSTLVATSHPAPITPTSSRCLSSVSAHIWSESQQEPPGSCSYCQTLPLSSLTLYNIAGRIFQRHNFDHITPSFKSFQWFPPAYVSLLKFPRRTPHIIPSFLCYMDPPWPYQLSELPHIFNAST